MSADRAARDELIALAWIDLEVDHDDRGLDEEFAAGVVALVDAGWTPRGTIATALEAALDHAEQDDADGATVALARRYARELDEAAVVSAAITKALRELGAVNYDLHDKFLALAARIEEAAVAASIGPKLLAALEQLQMTPRARAAVVKGGGGNATTGNGAESEMERIRRERAAARQHPA